jgi:hypothetical protein
MFKKVLLSGIVVSSIYGGDYAIESSIVDDWNSGFCKSVNVTNTSGSVLEWEIDLTVDGTIFEVWHAAYAQNGTTVTYQGLEGNTTLAPNAVASFGYCAHKPISNDTTLLNITHSVSVDWGTGFCKDIALHNPSSTRVEWNIDFDAGGEVSNLWDASHTQDDNLVLHANGLDYNKIVEPGATVTFGYCANRVAQEESVSDAQSVELDSTALTFETIKNYNIDENTIATNLALPTEGEHDTAITWSSSNTAYISDSGVVTQPTPAEGVQSVTLSATITKGAETQNKTFVLSVVVDTLFSEFNLGFGGAYAFKFLSQTSGEHIWVSSVDLVMDENLIYNSYYQQIKNFNAAHMEHIHNKLKNSKFLVYWFSKGWQVSWYDRSKIQKAMDAGYVPIFNYWYFGDGLVNGMPTELEKQEYAQDNIRVAQFLSQLKGRKIVIMEPEFNKNSVVANSVTQNEFASLMSSAIDTIKAQNPNTLFSLSMMDKGNRGVYETYTKCGYAHCALGDKDEWARPEAIYNQLLSRLDFVSFQQNIAQFSRDPYNDTQPIIYTGDALGIDYFSERVLNFTQFLYQKYNKPVFIPSISVATATWSDDNNNSAVETNEINYQGWEVVAENIYNTLKSSKTTLQANGLFGFAAMALFDNPRQDYGGYQFFLQNEYHLGLIGSIAVDEIDDGIDGQLIFKRNILEAIFD